LRDALHIASMPEADGARLLLIKRLNLGRISARMISPTLAVLIGHATRAAAERAVRFDQPGAESADAVTFPSRADALVTLARRHARKEFTREWFWDQIAPGWNQTPSRVARWEFVLAAAHALECAVGTAGAMLHEAALAGVIDEVINAVPPRDAAHWLRGMGWTPGCAREATCRPLPISQEIAAVLVPLRDLLGGDDIRVVWVGALLAVHEQAARNALSDLPARIAAWLRQIQGGRDAREPGTVRPHVSLPLQDDSPPHPRSEDHTGTGAGIPISASIDGSTHKADSLARSGTPPVNDTPWIDATAFSPCAGLLFIATVLTRIRFGQMRARQSRLRPRPRRYR
jgi:hypothetical protein